MEGQTVCYKLDRAFDPPLLSSRYPTQLTCVCPTDDVLRSHGGPTAERNRIWERGYNFKPRESRKRRPNRRASHSLFRRYPVSSLPSPLHRTRKTNCKSIAIISFLAAFFLIGYTIHEAKLELKLEYDLERTDSYNSSDGHRSHHVRERSVMKHDARIVNVCRFNPTLPPIQLLERCNYLCMFLTALGFTLEIMAILCFAWDQMGVVVSSFASGLTLFCLVASAIVMRPPSA